MLPIVEQLANPALKDRHWRGILTMLGAEKAVCALVHAVHNCHKQSVRSVQLFEFFKPNCKNKLIIVCKQPKLLASTKHSTSPEHLPCCLRSATSCSTLFSCAKLLRSSKPKTPLLFVPERTLLAIGFASRYDAHGIDRGEFPVDCPPSTLYLSIQDDENSIKQSEQGIWDPFSVDDLLHRGVASQLEALQTISVNASKEYGLEKALDKMHADWDGMEFRILEYKDTGTYIVGGTDEIQVRE